MKLFSKQTFVVVVYPHEEQLVNLICDRVGPETIREYWSDELKGYLLSDLGAIALGLIDGRTAVEAHSVLNHEFKLIKEIP